MLKTKDEVRWQEQKEGNYLIYYNQDIFEANDVVVKVLELCRSPQTSKSLMSAFLGEYDVDAEILKADLAQIIPQLQGINVLEEVDNGQ